MNAVTRMTTLKHPSRENWRGLLSLSALVGVAAAVAVFFSSGDVARAGVGGPLNGYIWSDNIGWISLNCSDSNSCATSNYAVSYEESSGNMTGYGWSDNIGWISFNGSDVAGCPSSPCQPQINKGGGTASGWAKALAGGSGGWDGWISLSGSNYGLTRNKGLYTGWVWGSDVVGWIDFTANETCTPYYDCNGQNITYTDASCRTSNVTKCDPPSFCSSGSSVCLYPQPTGGFTMNDVTIVAPGQTTTISWSVDNVKSCTVTGTNGDSWSGSSGSKTTSPINEETVYTLSCATLDDKTYVRSHTVKTAPVFKEI